MEELHYDDTHNIHDAHRSALHSFIKQTKSWHDRIPYVNKLPFPATAMIIAVGCVNSLVWAAVGIVLVS